MADFVFTSPGVKFKERDLTYVTRNVGITTLGLAGETLKGPAFEPVFIQDQTEFKERFGIQSTKRFPDGNLQYQLPYVANAFLEEAQQLYVTRVLGLSGYEAGPAWNIVIEAGVDESTSGGTSTGVTQSTGFTDNSFLGVAIGGTGITGTSFTGWTKNVSTDEFSTIITTFTATTYSSSTQSGTVDFQEITYSAASHTAYENMVIAVIRSRGDSQIKLNDSFGAKFTDFQTTELTIRSNATGNTTINGIGDLYGKFTLDADNPITNTGSTYSGSSASYRVSVNPNDSSFLPNVIGNTPQGKDTMIWVQAIYPDLIKKLDEEGLAYGIRTEMIPVDKDVDIFGDYTTSYKTPETPWVVSQIKGNTVDKLFKFISISDGDSANEEIKVTIQNINPYTLEFDVVVRNFYDTDDNPSVLETFTKCTLIKGANNYIGQKIGTSDGEYTLNSKYIMAEIADDLPNDVFPAGFEGYMMNNYTTDVTKWTTGSPFDGIPPAIFYKTEYQDTDRVSKTYLGLSELGYTGDGINQNMFDFINFYSGQPSSGFTKSKGFHMDSGATFTFDGYEFETGAGDFQTQVNVDDPTNPYYNIATRKFTLAPAGGFDGWDVNRRSRSIDDAYRQGGRQAATETANQVPDNDFQAWEMAIDTFANPEDVTINIFATPGINWAYQTVLVQNTIEMIEEQRTDTLYVIDSPELAGSVTATVGGSGSEDVAVATEISQLLTDTSIDSNYSCTYFPWIQIRDTQNNVNVYVPPTGEVIKAMAFTDNTRFPWFAPAGLTRGVTNARKSMYKLSLEARDILYDGRINPMADFADTGTAIFGNKTLQVRESALDRINVRRLLLQIKVLISNIAVRLLFEQNDQTTIDSFLNQANPILDSIKRERGLTDFRIKMDDSNNTPETRDRNELYGEIFLKPTRALEFIGITFTITPSGASFDDVGA